MLAIQTENKLIFVVNKEGCLGEYFMKYHAALNNPDLWSDMAVISTTLGGR